MSIEEKMPRLVAELHAQFAESAKLEQAINANLRGWVMAGDILSANGAAHASPGQRPTAIETG